MSLSEPPGKPRSNTTLPQAKGPQKVDAIGFCISGRQTLILSGEVELAK
jgi:hypothetical protein